MKWGLNVAVKKFNRVSSKKAMKKRRSSSAVVGGTKRVLKLALKASIGASLGFGQLLTIALIGK